MGIRWCIVAIVVFSLGSNVCAESADQPSNASVARPVDPVQEIRLGRFVATFEATTLGEIRDALGVGSVEHTGDAGESLYWLCYSLPGQQIQLKSHGEMGGPENRLSGVSATLVNAFRENDQCPMIPGQFQPVSFNFGWIGVSQNDLIKALGRPSEIDGNRLIFQYERDIYEKRVVIGSSSGRVEGTAVDGKIISLEAWHVTSY